MENLLIDVVSSARRAFRAATAVDEWIAIPGFSPKTQGAVRLTGPAQGIPSLTDGRAGG
ncbi:hypothetical protein [Acidovorax sp. SUPP2539]|uniref:hypothetical protein n=1 Tax=Acidovorax sp. SUPP2539 TaxID=2920878 RepID=UPI0024E0E652|nr:hypothetical protein [Acidovorax sp. SUPP2539]